MICNRTLLILVISSKPTMAANQAIYDPVVMKIGASFEAEETVDDDDDGPFGSASTSQVCWLFSATLDL